MIVTKKKKIVRVNYPRPHADCIRQDNNYRNSLINKIVWQYNCYGTYCALERILFPNYYLLVYKLSLFLELTQLRCLTHVTIHKTVLYKCVYKHQYLIL